VNSSYRSLAERFNSAATADVTIDGTNGVLQPRDLIEAAPGQLYTVADRAFPSVGVDQACPLLPAMA
jgi:hypothetical protein